MDSNSWSRFEKTPFNTRHKVACPPGRRERHHSEGIKVRTRVLKRRGDFYVARTHQITSSSATPRTSTSKSRPLHRRTREMPGQTARDGSATNELVGEELMDVKDRINLGSGHLRPAEAQRRHPLCRGAGVCAGCPRGERTGAVGDIGVDAGRHSRDRDRPGVMVLSAVCPIERAATWRRGVREIDVRPASCQILGSPIRPAKPMSRPRLGRRAKRPDPGVSFPASASSHLQPASHLSQK